MRVLTHLALSKSLRRGAAALMLLCVGMSMNGQAGSVPEGQPFVISVDGVAIDGSGRVTDKTRKADVDLEAVDIQVKFDGLGAEPTLNISTDPVRAAYEAGETVTFRASLNYPAFVNRREIRIFAKGDLGRQQTYATLKLSADGAAAWIMPPQGPAEFEYVLRVYDEAGRFDETAPLPLIRASRDLKQHEPAGKAIVPGLGEDRTAIRNIPVSGGAVTVYGKNIPKGHKVHVFGEEVPVDGRGTFVTQRILATGPHAVEVAVLRDGKGMWFSRDVEIPRSDWFYVALADLTAGYRFGAGNIEPVKPGEYDNLYTRGRLAFYVKGKIKGQYLLTAAADTGEDEIQNLFKGIDGKDPRQYLRRIDPDDYYPVYGDDSTAIEDAPTRGKFYVRLEKGPSHVMWGNFRSNITGATFLRSNRALYGASGVYRSKAVTAGGEAQSSVDVYVAQPGTLPQHDVFRGTGGSAYFLKFQDITPGSETVAIEQRNAATGWVVSRRTLKDGDDYDLDDVQGVLLLKSPVPSTGTPGTENYVVVDYEYTPASGEADGYVMGGRAQQWLGDHLRAGVTGMTDKTGAADQRLYGADLRLQAAPDSYLEAEIARSEGPGFSKTYSADGGLTLEDTATAGSANRRAEAWRVEGHGSLEDLTGGTLRGSIGARYEHQNKGFSTRDTDVAETRRAWGADLDAEITDRVKVAGTYSDLRVDDGSIERDARVKLRAGLTEHVSIEPYGHYSEKEQASPGGENTGKRGDAGLRGTYEWDEQTELYAFGQTTVTRTGMRLADHRGGIGGKRQLTEKIDVAGEASYGSLGPDVTATIGYAPTADDRYYVGYRLDAERSSSSSWPYDLTGQDLGSIVTGAKRRFSEEWSAYGEDNYDMFGERRSLTQAYGLTYTPDAEWTIGGGVEVGTVYDNTINSGTGLKNPDVDRKAISASAVYRGADGIDGKAKGEMRFDNSEDDSRDADSYLLALAIGVKLSDDWRALASLDAVVSNATQSTRDGEYVEGSMGFAYRPAAGDRFNMLAKYTFLYDLPGADQVSVDGTLNGPAQRSHIASVDASYDLTNKLTIGAKYGVRIGEQRDRDPTADWESSIVQLGILRADFHVTHQWDLLLEGRTLWNTDAGTAETGALAAVYRQLGDNMKLGIGYNFGSFSDDLRDLVHDDQGVFVNLIGKI